MPSGAAYWQASGALQIEVKLDGRVKSSQLYRRGPTSLCGMGELRPLSPRTVQVYRASN